MRATERQAAEELGQWITKSEPSQLSVQKQFRGRTLGEIAYVGMHSVRLFEDLNLNETPDNILSNTANVTNPFLGLLPPASTPGQGATRSA